MHASKWLDLTIVLAIASCLTITSGCSETASKSSSTKSKKKEREDRDLGEFYAYQDDVMVPTGEPMTKVGYKYHRDVYLKNPREDLYDVYLESALCKVDDKSAIFDTKLVGIFLGDWKRGEWKELGPTDCYGLRASGRAKDASGAPCRFRIDSRFERFPKLTDRFPGLSDKEHKTLTGIVINNFSLTQRPMPKAREFPDEQLRALTSIKPQSAESSSFEIHALNNERDLFNVLVTESTDAGLNLKRFFGRWKMGEDKRIGVRVGYAFGMNYRATAVDSEGRQVQINLSDAPIESK